MPVLLFSSGARTRMRKPVLLVVVAMDAVVALYVLSIKAKATPVSDFNTVQEADGVEN
jgi:hypothetical protein